MDRSIFVAIVASFAGLLSLHPILGDEPTPRPGPHPIPVPSPGAQAIDDSIQRGVEFLLERRNRDGSWGSPRNTKGLNIYGPVPGAHHAFRIGVTSLCISALIEAGGESDQVEEAVRRAEDWLLETLPRLRRATPDAIYNIWGHAYSIQALVRLLDRHASHGPRRHDLEKQIRSQMDLLGRYEFVNGGWSYYDFEIGSQKPAGSPTCFTTATVLVALYEAREAGIEQTERLIQRALDSIRRQQNPDFSYNYKESLRWSPRRYINRHGGSLGRSQSCNLALRLWGDEKITDDVITTCFNRLVARNLWLDMGRKRPIPHESWFQVAGYFYYYGHYYAALCMEELEPPERPPLQDQLASILLRLQEKDGSWWDFPFYDYHQQYGTAFALMALERCRPTEESPPKKTHQEPH